MSQKITFDSSTNNLHTFFLLCGMSLKIFQAHTNSGPSCLGLLNTGITAVLCYSLLWALIWSFSVFLWIHTWRCLLRHKFLCIIFFQCPPLIFFSSKTSLAQAHVQRACYWSRDLIRKMSLYRKVQRTCGVW